MAREEDIPHVVCVVGTVHKFGAELIEGCLLPAIQSWGPTLVPSGGIPFSHVITPHSHWTLSSSGENGQKVKQVLLGASCWF